MQLARGLADDAEFRERPLYVAHHAVVAGGLAVHFPEQGFQQPPVGVLVAFEVLDRALVFVRCVNTPLIHNRTFGVVKRKCDEVVFDPRDRVSECDARVRQRQLVRVLLVALTFRLEGRPVYLSRFGFRDEFGRHPSEFG